MKIIKVKNNPAEIKWFHQVTDQIYANDGQYIKPIISDIEGVFKQDKNPRFQKGDAIRWVILGEDHRTPVGRIAAFYHDIGSKRKGAWGFFECINDVMVFDTLIDLAESWLKSHSCESVQAPVNFGSRDQFWGLWISGNRRPSYQENYHPEYYRELIERRDYRIEIEQTTYLIDHESFKVDRFKKIAERTFGNHSYEYRILDFGKIDDFADDFVEIYNAAWSFHEDFEKLELSNIRRLFHQMKPALLPELGIFAYHEGRPIGFFISIMELNEIFKDFNGKLGWWQKLQFLMKKKQIRTARGIVFGIIPAYQNKGVEAGMIMKSHEVLTKINRFDQMELSWIGDFNPKMISMLNALGAKLIKTHHTYLKIFS